MQGIIKFFLNNRVAANLFAFIVLFTGLISLTVLDVRLFPQITLNLISVTVPYPGATPKEVENSIVKPIEERIDGLEGVDKVTSLAASGMANILVKLDENVSIPKLKDDIQSQIDTITVFPRQSERPIVKHMEQPELVSRIIIFGDQSTELLKQTAERVRSDLIDLPNVSRAEIGGVAENLIEVTVSQDRLIALNVSLNEIAQAITDQNLDLSAGVLEGSNQRLLVRSVGEKRTGDAIKKLVVGYTETSTPIYLGDIATVTDALSETPSKASYKGKPAVYLTVFRVGDEQVLDLARDINGYFNHEISSVLPAGISADLWRDESVMLDSRLSLLSNNAMIGLGLVGILLMAFLDIRIAVWVAFGVAVSFIGSIALMAAFGVSINMMTAFAFILAIGIVVDDAIVVGENIHTYRKSHSGPTMEAATKGVLSISTPVIFSVMTTIVAFIPLMTLPGTMGDFLGPVAAVVICVLVLSLVESLLMLPRHLSHLNDDKKSLFQLKIADPFRDYFAHKLNIFIQGPYKKSITFVVNNPVSIIAMGFGIFILSLSLITGGTVKSIFFPKVEGDYINAQVHFTETTSQNLTIKQTKAIAAAAERVAKKLEETEPNPLKGIFWILGNSPSAGMDMPSTSAGAEANKGYIVARLKDASERKFTADEFSELWRKEVGAIPGAQKLTFNADLITQADPVYFAVSTLYEKDGPKAVADIRRALENIPGVYEIRDDRFNVTDEVQISLKPLARTYGFTQKALADQVRAAFFGAEAVRIQRDREEIQVRVRLPKYERLSAEALRYMRIKIGDGFIPIYSLADISIKPAAANINRVDGRRIFEVTTNVNRKLVTPGAVTNAILNEIAPELAKKYKGLKITLSGEQEEQETTAPVIGMNYMLALMVIYTILALGFKSYSQPLIVMLAIPFGYMGGLIGHALLGLEMTLLSIFGIIGLSGVIVNNSLMVISVVNDKLDAGTPHQTAIIDAALMRFRPILLTTLTTFLGVTPLILETSIQAQFLVPTAVSLGFGIVIGTSVLIFLTPALAVVHYRIFGRK